MYATLRLAIVFFFVALIQLSIYHAGFIDVSGDGFFRALMAHDWRASPSIITRDYGIFSLFWFPPYFWLTGSVYWLTDNLPFSLKSISLLSSFAGLLALYVLTCHLADKRAAIITVLIVAIIPFHLWLSLSMAETHLFLFFVLLAFLFLLRWIQLRRKVDIILASFSLLGCSMLRPEGWILAGLFTVYAMFSLPKNCGSFRHWMLLVVTTPLVFILIWLADNWIYYGNPIYFITAEKTHIDAHPAATIALEWMRGLQLIFFMIVLSPALCLSILAALIFKWRSLDHAARAYLAFIFLYSLSLIILFILGLGTTAAPQRYGMIPLILLAPFAGWLISDGLGGPLRAKFVSISLLSLILVLSLLKSFSFPTLYRDAVAAGTYIGGIPNASDSRQSPRIATEHEIRRLVGAAPSSERDFFVLASEHAASVVYSGRPGDFLTNPLRLTQVFPNHQATAHPAPTLASPLATAIAEKDLDALLVRDRWLMEHLPIEFSLKQTFGRYAVFTRYGDALQPEKTTRATSATERQLRPEITLAAHRYDGALFPATVVVSWLFSKSPQSGCPYQIRVKAEHRDQRSYHFVQQFRPIFCWYNLSGDMSDALIDDHISLDLPTNMPSGEYDISIALVTLPGPDHDAATGIAGNSHWINLPPIRLVHSKRSMIMDYITGRNRDLPLLLYVLATL